MITTRAPERAYDRLRRRRIKEGTWLYPVQHADVRQHLDRLTSAGMSLAAVAAAARLSPGTVYPIVHTKGRRYVNGATAVAILAVTPPPRPAPPVNMKDSTGTARRLQALVAAGYSISDLSRRLGYKNMQQTWEWVWHRQPLLTAVNAERVADLFEQLSATPGPSNRARGEAQRRGWLPPLAWDDNIDDPDATPNLGEDRDDIVDHVAIAEVLAGRLKFTDLREQEKFVLFRDHLNDWGYNPIMNLLQMSAGTVTKWRTRARYGTEQVAA